MKPGDTAICRNCGEKIIYTYDGYWKHDRLHPFDSVSCYIEKPKAEPRRGTINQIQIEEKP